MAEVHPGTQHHTNSTGPMVCSSTAGRSTGPAVRQEKPFEPFFKNPFEPFTFNSEPTETNVRHTDFYLHVLVYFKTIMIEVLVLRNYKTATTELEEKKKS